LIYLISSHRNNICKCCFYIDKPGPPTNLTVGSVTENSVTLNWEIPEKDGGSPVTGYVVEMRSATKKTWVKVDTTEQLTITVEKLAENTQYYFRVAAQNAVGVGEFVELSQGVSPKSQFGK